MRERLIVSHAMMRAQVGFTPLLIACYNKHVEVVKVLLANKAAVDKANKVRGRRCV